MTSKNNIVYERSSLVENKNFKVNETYKRNSHFFKNSMFKGNIQNIQNNITPSERNSYLFGNSFSKGNIQNNVTPSERNTYLFGNNLGKIQNNVTPSGSSNLFEDNLGKGNIQNNVTPSERNSNLFGNNLGKGNIQNNVTPSGSSNLFEDNLGKGNIQNIQNNVTPSGSSNLFEDKLGKGNIQNIQNNVTPSGSSNFFENNLGKIYNKPINLVNNLVQKSKKKYFWENVNEPSIWVSLLIPSYNTPKEFLISCINSIKEQFGTFGLEIVWINDSSNDVATNILVNLLETIIRPLKNCKLIYERLEENSGISNCLNYGVNLCSNEIIFRMDSDDIMKNHRIVKQLNFILSNPQCVMCGTNITAFEHVNGINSNISDSIHKNILTWEEYKKDPKDWILNHPTLCFKKSAILHVGNYNKELKLPFEDLDLELRILKNYGVVYNLNESLVLYRIHKGQVSNNNSEYSKSVKEIFIKTMTTS